MSHSSGLFNSLTWSEDDLPYDEEENPVTNEQLWSGVYEIAAAKMKEEAEEWKGLMDVSLVFVSDTWPMISHGLHRCCLDCHLLGCIDCFPRPRRSSPEPTFNQLSNQRDFASNFTAAKIGSRRVRAVLSIAYHGSTSFQAFCVRRILIASVE